MFEKLLKQYPTSISLLFYVLIFIFIGIGTAFGQTLVTGILSIVFTLSYLFYVKHVDFH
jgi:uncharacterized membrane protein